MKANQKNDIYVFLQANKEAISSYGMKKIGLFGSFVRDKQTEDSDINILVEFDEEKENDRNFIHLAFYREDHLNRKVDLLTPDSLSPFIGPKILQEVEYVPF